MQPNEKKLARTISACAANGSKLLEDAKLLFGWDRHSTALALAVLAQEEFAKAFILQLVSDSAIPWIPEVRQSVTRHQCKHLLGLVMEWLPILDLSYERMMRDRERADEQHNRRMAWYERRIARLKGGILEPDPGDPEPLEPEVPFPAEIANAVNIYRHEEVERLRKGGYPWTDEDWAKGLARKVAEGKFDRKKQNALYVTVKSNGDVGAHPGLITESEASEAIKRAERLSEDPDIFSDEYKELKRSFALIFSNLRQKQTLSTQEPVDMICDAES